MQTNLKPKHFDNRIPSSFIKIMKDKGVRQSINKRYGVTEYQRPDVRYTCS